MNRNKERKKTHVHSDKKWRTWGRVCWCVWYWRGHALKCIVLGINHQSRMLILPWPCAECGGNGVCGAKDNTAAFVLEENNTADDAALCCRHRCCCRHRPRSHVSLCQVTRPDKVAIVKDTDDLMYSSVFILCTHYSGALWFYNYCACLEFYTRVNGILPLSGLQSFNQRASKLEKHLESRYICQGCAIL